MPKKPVRMTSTDVLIKYACNGLHGRSWYADATNQIDYVSFLEGWDRNEFAGVIATTSPRCSVVRNIRMSLHFMHHRDIRVVPMKGIRKSVTNFLAGKGIKGQKTRAFCANLSGCPDSVTLDVWMSYALGIDQKDFNVKANREKATDRIVSVASEMSVTPAEAQAMVWTGYRTIAGYNHSPFSIASEYFAARAAKWDVAGCSIHEA